MSRESYESIAMNSRPECHGDETLVTLTADQKSVIRDGVTRAIDAARFVAEQALKDKMMVSTRANGLGVAFAELERVAAAAGFSTDREADHNATLSVLRAANGRIRELESQLAESVTSEALAQAVKKAVDSIYPAWKKAGFNYAGDVSLGARYLTARLSCDADDGMFSHSDTPESDKQSADELRAALERKGVTFTGDGRNREDRRVVDTDANKAAITAVILEIWPAARITNWRSHYTNFGSPEGFVIRDVEVLIPVESLLGR